MNNCTTIPIISVNGDSEGNIIIDVVPINEKGELYEEIPENPKDLVGQNFKYYVHIKEVKDLPENFCEGLQVEYTSFTDNYSYKTKIYNEDGKDTSFLIDEKFEHNIGFLTEEDIDFFLKDKICFKIYAIEKIDKKEKKGIPSREEILRSHIIEEKSKKADENDKEKGNFVTRSNTLGFLKKLKGNDEDKDKKDCTIF